jgi:hypothetical protein
MPNGWTSLARDQGELLPETSSSQGVPIRYNTHCKLLLRIGLLQVYYALDLVLWQCPEPQDKDDAIGPASAGGFFSQPKWSPAPPQH